MAIGRIPEPGTGIQESIIAAKGDLISGTANDAPAILTVGANGTTLVADSSEATGLKWATPAGSAFVGVRVRSNTTAQVIANTTVVVITWTGTEDFDTDAFHNGSTNTSRLTVPAGKSGYYQISGVAQFSTLNGTGRRACGLSVNGTNISTAETAPSNVSLITLNPTTIYYLNDADYVEMSLYQESGGNMNSMGNAQLSFEMARIG